MESTILTNARVIDVESGRYLPDGVEVVITDGRISSVEPGASNRPDDATLMNMGGRAIVPGMFNTHCHLFMGPPGIMGARQVAKSLADCVDRGVTNIRDAMCFDLRDSRTWSDRVHRGDVPGPGVNQAVHISILGGTYAPVRNPATLVQLAAIGMRPIDYDRPESGIIALRPDAATQDFRDAVDRAIDQRGAETIKLCDQPEHFGSYLPGAPVLSQAQMDTVADQARRRGVPTTMHNVTAAGFSKGVRAGLTSLAHLPLDAVLEQADIDAFMAGQTMFEPTMSLTYFLCYSLRGSPLAGHPEIERLDRIREASYERVINESWVRELRRFRLGIHRILVSGNPRIMGLVDVGTPFNYYQPFISIGAENLRRLVGAGAADRLACGTDAGASNCGPAAIDIEIQMLDFALNREGQVLKPADFLRSATINSARSLGMEDSFGSIKPGKNADIAVLDGDPLSDWGVIGRPARAVFKGGKMVVNRLAS